MSLFLLFRAALRGSFSFVLVSWESGGKSKEETGGEARDGKEEGQQALSDVKQKNSKFFSPLKKFVNSTLPFFFTSSSLSTRPPSPRALLFKHTEREQRPPTTQYVQSPYPCRGREIELARAAIEPSVGEETLLKESLLLVAPPRFQWNN